MSVSLSVALSWRFSADTCDLDLWPCHFDLWPVDLRFYIASSVTDVVKLCSKFYRSYCDFSIWSYDLEHMHGQGGTCPFPENVVKCFFAASIVESIKRRSILCIIERKHRQLLRASPLVSLGDFSPSDTVIADPWKKILRAPMNKGRKEAHSKRLVSKIEDKFHTFWHLPVEIKEGMGRMLNGMIELVAWSYTAEPVDCGTHLTVAAAWSRRLEVQ